MAVKAEHPELIVHAANSAALLREAGAQLDMVRCGIAVYGMTRSAMSRSRKGSSRRSS